MHLLTSITSFLRVSLAAKDVFAALHGNYQELRNKQDLATNEFTETNMLIECFSTNYYSGEITSTLTTSAPAIVAITSNYPDSSGLTQSSRSTTLEVVAISSTAAYDASASSVAAESNKLGLLVGGANPNAAFINAARWCWNWAATPTFCPSSLEFVPIMWGEGFGRQDTWTRDALAAITAGSTTLMAFNEPELAAQANIPDPATCASKYMEYMQPFAGKARLCSPSVTDNTAPNTGLDYMRHFLEACNGLGCTIDILCIHVYKTYDAIDYFKQQLVNAYALTNNRTNIWVTEWGLTNGSEEQQATYMREAMAFMQSQHWIERQSYFYIDPTIPILTNTDGTPSMLGEVYISPVQ